MKMNGIFTNLNKFEVILGKKAELIEEKDEIPKVRKLEKLESCSCSLFIKYMENINLKKKKSI